MIPSADRVMTRRHTIVIVLRLACGGLFLAGAMPLVYVLVKAVLWSGFGYIRHDPEGIGRIAFSAACLLPAIVVLVFQDRLTRWLVPLPRAECPKCGYSMTQAHEGRCPECGLVIEPASARDETAGARST